MAAHPALRPLALTLKALLRTAAPAPLNDVATGGLGSYSLVNMLVAHLMLDAQVMPYCALWMIPASVCAMRHAYGDHDNIFNMHPGRIGSGSGHFTLYLRSSLRGAGGGRARATGAACC